MPGILLPDASSSSTITKHKPIHMVIQDDFDVDSFVYDFTFPRRDADIVLVSGDKSFYAHRMILATASPFFRDLFSLPQPSTRTLDDPQEDVVRLPESAPVLNLLLQLIYPIPKPVLNAKTLPIPLFSDLLGAAVKYDLYFPLSHLRSTLLSPEAGYLAQDATRVYAVACRYNLDREAREAMRAVVRTGVDMVSMPLEDEWKYVSAWEYRRLETWVREKRRRIGRRVKSWYGDTVKARDSSTWGYGPAEDEEERRVLGWMTDLPKCMQCNGSPFHNKDEPKWWVEFVKRVSISGAAGIGGTDRMFEMEFLADVVRECECPRCAGSVMGCGRFMNELKRVVERIVDEDEEEDSEEDPDSGPEH